MQMSGKNILLLALMLASAGLAFALRPTISLADERAPINLKAAVPTAFGDWEELLHTSAQIIDPQRKQKLEELYSETLTRTYVNRAGYQIMLSIAYGKNQSDAVQLHKPEICYPAQGFALGSQSSGNLAIDSQSRRSIAVTRLTTKLGLRNEPVTYWTTVGDNVVQGQFDKKVAEMKYAFVGRIPDGLLVRFSSIGTDVARAFGMQSQFAATMVQTIDPAIQKRFVGSGVLN